MEAARLPTQRRPVCGLALVGAAVHHSPMTRWVRRRRSAEMSSAVLQVVSATRRRLDGFRTICDRATMADLGWTSADVDSMCAQMKSGRTDVSLVVNRSADQVVGCVISARTGATLTLVGWIGVEHRCKGYGTDLLDLVCADAFADGCSSVLIALRTPILGLPPSSRNGSSWRLGHTSC